MATNKPTKPRPSFDIIDNLQQTETTTQMFTVGEYTGGIIYCCSQRNIPYEVKSWNKFPEQHNAAIAEVLKNYDELFEKWTKYPKHVIESLPRYTRRICRVTANISKDDMVNIFKEMNTNSAFGDLIHQMNHGGEHSIEYILKGYPIKENET